MPEASRAEVNSSRTGNILLTRLPVIAALLIVLGGLAIGVHRYHHLPQAWQAFGVPALNFDFADTRTITHSIDCVLSGRDPYVDRSFDPWHRLYNYPPIWLQLRHLGVRSTSTRWVAGFFWAAFFCSCLALFRARNWITAATILLALLSWPVLFALERGNTDLLIFAMLTLGALWMARGGRLVSTLWQGVLIVVLTILKIFPVVTVVAMLRSRKMVWKASIVAIVAVVALAVTSGSELVPTLRNTPQVTFESFGSLPLSVRLGHPADRWAIAVILAVAGILIGLLGRDPLTRRLPRIDLYSARGFIAAAGLIIYGFVFFFGSSYDYRLIFLLCPLMYLVEELNQRITIGPLAASIVLLLFLWCARFEPGGPKEFLDAVVFLGTCAWLANTLRHTLGPHSPDRPTARMDEERPPLVSGANAMFQ